MVEHRRILEPDRSGPHDFLLQRFQNESADVGSHLVIAGSIWRQENILTLHYMVSGDIADLVLPAPAGPGRRRDGLWQHTCCEAFLGARGAEGYWEVNLAPGGDWNVYAFSSYRKEMTEETAIASLPCSFHGGDAGVRLDLQLDISPIFRQEEVIEAGISAVMEHRDGTRSYWALCHHGTKADFHHRSGFLLVL